MSEPRNPNSPSTSAKPARARRTAPPTIAQPDAPPAGSTREAAPTSAARTRITATDRQGMIATAAYYRAEKRRFAPGFDLEDWLAAESEIDGSLARGDRSA
ncbi:MAG TPA: DUF2934 domain-containing protein [Steroidobacteraceae bacterium]